MALIKRIQRKLLTMLYQRYPNLQLQTLPQERTPRQRLQMQTLPGCEYARYYLPLEYPPSFELTPRWGYRTPTHPGLTTLFQQNHDQYTVLLQDLRTLIPYFERIAPSFSIENAPEPGWVGGAINALDLAVLYYFISRKQPKTYLEIGSGVTTCFARRAMNDHQLATKVISIDPQPRAAIDSICDETIRVGLEALDLAIFAQLEPGDIVFIDGTHRCFMNSDVTVFMLDVLPILKPGVLVHFHDIVLPYDYPEMFVHWYWNEQYILAAYLLGARDRMDILMPTYYISRTPELSILLTPPLVDLPKNAESFLTGGSIWFTAREDA